MTFKMTLKVFFPPTSKNEGRVLRRASRLGLLAFLVIVSFVVSQAATGHPSGPDQAAGPVASGGYSIFHETMVDMTWPEVEKAARDGAVVLMTTAVIEEHGPHMSCGIDTYLGYLMCKITRRELEARGVKAVIAPPFYWGINVSSHVFPGTFTVRPETMKALLHDLLASPTSPQS